MEKEKKKNEPALGRNPRSRPTLVGPVRHRTAHTISAFSFICCGTYRWTPVPLFGHAIPHRKAGPT